jgi:hypothetical protein
VEGGLRRYFMVDFTLMAAIISAAAPLIAALWRFFSIVGRLEREIERGKAERKLLKERCDAALKFHDHRIRELEQALEAALNFTPRFQRDEGCTGASFLAPELSSCEVSEE